MDVRNGTGRWLKFRRGAPADSRLFCFHHAGGTAAAYRDWPQLLPPSVEPVAVQLPGRADRFGEPPFEAMWPLVDALVEVLEPLLDRPYACYGLSMGARISWALAHRLRELGLPAPAALYLASTAAPAVREGRPDWGARPEDLVDYLRALGGTPPEIFAEPELLEFLLRTLRADLTLVDSFQFRPEKPLDMPIHAFAGTEDSEGPPERMRGWGAETSGNFELHAVPGGHFFGVEGEQRVTRTIAEDLRHRATERGTVR